MCLRLFVTPNTYLLKIHTSIAIPPYICQSNVPLYLVMSALRLDRKIRQENPKIRESENPGYGPAAYFEG
jgi:hypothetical protein